MNEDKELEEAKEYLPFIIRDLEASCYNKNFINALKIIKKEIENSIPTKKIEDIILELQEAIVLENSSMYGHGDEEYIKEIELKIVALQELLEDK